tara:strand:+ start:146 stop:379 length:234 start_codon:yes stop_codon:yes gene_type:complete
MSKGEFVDGIWIEPEPVPIEESEREVDGVTKRFITVDGVEWEVADEIMLDDDGNPMFNEDGTPVLVDRSNNKYERKE